MPIFYTLPAVPPGETINQVMPESAEGLELTPERIVEVINRGREIVTEKWNGENYSFAPGRNHATYAVAAHAQNKAVVPGSRNVETGTYLSWLGITDIDPPEACVPFTDEEIASFKGKPEAVERKGTEVRLVGTAEARAKLPGQGAGRLTQAGGGRSRRPVSDGGQQASPQAEEAARLAMVPPVGGEAAAVSAGDVDGEV